MIFQTLCLLFLFVLWSISFFVNWLFVGCMLVVIVIICCMLPLYCLFGKFRNDIHLLLIIVFLSFCLFVSFFHLFTWLFSSFFYNLLPFCFWLFSVGMLLFYYLVFNFIVCSAAFNVCLLFLPVLLFIRLFVNWIFESCMLVLVHLSFACFLLKYTCTIFSWFVSLFVWCFSCFCISWLDCFLLRSNVYCLFANWLFVVCIVVFGRLLFVVYCSCVVCLLFVR